jgi:hypothetical protein
VRRLHAYATTAPRTPYTARLVGGKNGGEGAVLHAGRECEVAPLAAARAGLGPPVPGAAVPGGGPLDKAGLAAALRAGLARGGVALTEADKGPVVSRPGE